MFNSLAAKIASYLERYGVDKAIAIDPAILDIIKQILAALMAMLPGCFGATPTLADVLAMLKNPSIVQRWLLRLAIRGKINDLEMSELIALPMGKAFLAVGAKATEADAKPILDALAV